MRYIMLVMLGILLGCSGNTVTGYDEEEPIEEPVSVTMEHISYEYMPDVFIFNVINHSGTHNISAFLRKFLNGNRHSAWLYYGPNEKLCSGLDITFSDTTKFHTTSTYVPDSIYFYINMDTLTLNKTFYLK